MASIGFNDGTAATLDNGTTGVADAVGSRFANWTPFTRRVGDTAVALESGKTIIVATSGGNQQIVGGGGVVLGLNAYIRPGS